MTPRKLYAALAKAEMVTWALLIGGIILKYSADMPLGVRIAGPIHGFTFLSYCVVTALLWINNRWSFLRLITGLLSAVIPFATVPFERSTEKAGLLDGPWRFSTSNEQPQGFLEYTLAFIVRRPWLSAALIVVFVSMVFAVLLALGSPLEAIKNQ